MVDVYRRQTGNIKDESMPLETREITDYPEFFRILKEANLPGAEIVPCRIAERQQEPWPFPLRQVMVLEPRERWMMKSKTNHAGKPVRVSRHVVQRGDVCLAFCSDDVRIPDET